MFIKLTIDDNIPLILNTDKIISVEQIDIEDEQINSTIYTEQGHKYFVKESVEEINELVSSVGITTI